MMTISKNPEEKLKNLKENRKISSNLSTFSKRPDVYVNNYNTSMKTDDSLLHRRISKSLPTLITDDYYYPKFIRHKLFIDVFNTSFIKIPPQKICQESRLLFLINSGSKNGVKRNYFRLHVKKYKINASWVFLTSIPTNYTHYHSLLKEADEYNDLIITPYPDSYEALTEKIGSGILWILKNCYKVETVLKSDDDVLINFNLFEKIPHENIMNFTIFGKLCTSCIPHSPGGIKKEKQNFENERLIVTRRHFPSTKFPNFFYGTSYGLSIDVLPLLLLSSLEADYFPYEDVFWTGILPRIFSEIYSTKIFSTEDFIRELNYINLQYRSSSIGTVLNAIKNFYLHKRALDVPGKRSWALKFEDISDWRVSSHKCLGSESKMILCKKYLTIHGINWEKDYEKYLLI